MPPINEFKEGHNGVPEGRTAMKRFVVVALALFLVAGAATAVAPPGAHSADYRGGDEAKIPASDYRIDLSELLRVIQLYNADGYHVAEGTEDGFAPGLDGQKGTPHSADYNGQDWKITLTELLRVLQFFNSGGYHASEGTEDGFAPGASPSQVEGEVDHPEFYIKFDDEGSSMKVGGDPASNNTPILKVTVGNPGDEKIWIAFSGFGFKLTQDSKEKEEDLSFVWEQSYKGERTPMNVHFNSSDGSFFYGFALGGGIEIDPGEEEVVELFLTCNNVPPEGIKLRPAMSIGGRLAPEYYPSSPNVDNTYSTFVVYDFDTGEYHSPWWLTKEEWNGMRTFTGKNAVLIVE